MCPNMVIRDVTLQPISKKITVVVHSQLLRKFVTITWTCHSMIYTQSPRPIWLWGKHPGRVSVLDCTSPSPATTYLLLSQWNLTTFMATCWLVNQARKKEQGLQCLTMSLEPRIWTLLKTKPIMQIILVLLFLGFRHSSQVRWDSSSEKCHSISVIPIYFPKQARIPNINSWKWSFCRS